VLRMAPAPPREETLPFSSQTSLVIGTIARFYNRWRVTMICIAALLSGWFKSNPNRYIELSRTIHQSPDGPIALFQVTSAHLH